MSFADTYDTADDLPEMPPAVTGSIASWRRTIAKAAAGNERAILGNAAADLFRTRKVNRTMYPETDGIVNQAIVDALQDMASAADIDPDDAQLIFAQAQREDAPSPTQNGSTTIDEAPPPTGPDDYGSAVPATIDDTSAIVPAKFTSPAAWPDEAPPPVNWLVNARIPRGDVTTLHGDGGAGKTDIALRLAANVARGAPDWFAHDIEPGKVLFISGEEPERELRRRIWQHAQHDGYSLDELADNFRLWIPDEISDAAMATAERYSSIMRPTRTMQEIAAAILDLAPILVVVDNVAATFAGNQNDRVSVRSYVNLWRQIAHGPSKPAVLLLDHPSLSGLTNGSGRGGSMDWRNAVRSALWLHPPTEGVEADRGIRILETTKSNYGPPGNPLRLVWAEGGLQLEQAPTSLHRIAKDQECDEAFLRLLDERAGQGLDVSANPSVLYAPKIFAAMPGNGGFAKRAFAEAMQRLLQSGKIVQRTDGPQSRRRSRLVRKPAA